MEINLAHELQDTWQGEYPLLGSPIKLIRFYGCNLGSTCPLDCDTKYSWGAKSDLNIDIEDIQPRSSFQNLMITGGEPFVQEEALFKLVEYWAANFKSNIIIETNGTLLTSFNLRHIYEVGDNRVYLSISPKFKETFMRVFDVKIPLGKFREKISFKLVVGKDLFPLNWAVELTRAIKEDHPIYLMPEGITSEQMSSNLDRVEQMGRLLKDRYKLSPRTHFYLGIK